MGIMIFLMLFCMFLLELLRIFDIQYAVEVRAQRAVNSAVEAAMDDHWRAWGYNFMDTDVAREKLKQYLKEDLGINDNGDHIVDGKVVYHVSYNADSSSVYDSGNPDTGGTMNHAKISIPISVKIHTTYNLFGDNHIFDIGFTNTYESTNFRLDQGERAGESWTK